jgi:hypothetical protein
MKSKKGDEGGNIQQLTAAKANNPELNKLNIMKQNMNRHRKRKCDSAYLRGRPSCPKLEVAGTAMRMQGVCFRMLQT